jgi:large subunit ribosomal protein L3
MKVGMLALFDKWGERHAVTVLQLDNCQVVQVKTPETDGYTALQLGVGEAKVKRLGVSKLGQYKKNDLTPNRKLSEFRVTPDALLPVGTKIHSMHFVPGQLVDVCGTSKGKGFAGVMKRWNFGGGRASHGNSLAHRIPGSTGCRQDPGRVFKNKKMPGRMGGERVTAQNLRLLKIDTTRDLLYIKGAVPGNNGSFVRVVDAVMGPFHPTPPPVPTFQGQAPADEIFAPVADSDIGKKTEPEDAY